MTDLQAAVPDEALAKMRTAGRLLVISQILLFGAGCRHHLVWGSTGNTYLWLNGLETACLLAACWTGAWALCLALRIAANGPLPRNLLRQATGIALTLAVLAPPFLSMDSVDYLLRGRVQAVHGGNPYVQVAADYPHDPLLAFGDAGWQQFPLPYGPAVADLQTAIAWLGHWPQLPPIAELMLGLLLLKLCFAGILLLAANMARRAAEVLRPGSGDRGWLLIAWNPLLLNECVVQAHNDVLLVLALVATIWLVGCGRFAIAATALAFGALVKIVPLVTAPLLLAAALKQRRWGMLLLGCLFPAAYLAQAAMRYFTAPGAMDFLARQSAVTGASLAWLAVNSGLQLAGFLWPGRSIVVLLTAFAAWRTWQIPSPRTLAVGMATVLLAMTALGVAVFGPWYHLWWSPLALLAASGWLLRAAWLATLLSPLGYVVWTADRSLGNLHQATMLSLGLVVPLLVAMLWRREPPGWNRRAPAKVA